MVLLGLALGACSAPKYRYVTNSTAKTYLKVPRAWKAFSGAKVRAATVQAASQVPGQLLPSEIDRSRDAGSLWQMVFDSDPNPDVSHALVQSRYPVVDVLVRALNPDERDNVSNLALRNFIVSYDELKKKAEEEKKLRPLGAPELLQSFESNIELEVQRPGGVRGVQDIYRLRGNDGTTYVMNQTVLVDSRNSRIYLLLVRAAEKEYLEHQDVILKIVDSFTVKQKA